jgi:hypothetical protein
MRTGGTWRGIGQGAFALLTCLALALIVAVPPGFMVGGGEGSAHIVICTGHGAVEAAVDLSGKGAPAHRGKSEAPCIFAGHAAPLTPTSAAPQIAIAWLLTAAPQATPDSQVAIGRGLAAPPPARGPPSSLT